MRYTVIFGSPFILASLVIGPLVLMQLLMELATAVINYGRACVHTIR